MEALRFNISVKSPSIRIHRSHEKVVLYPYSPTIYLPKSKGFSHCRGTRGNRIRRSSLWWLFLTSCSEKNFRYKNVAKRFLHGASPHFLSFRNICNFICPVLIKDSAYCLVQLWLEFFKTYRLLVKDRIVAGSTDQFENHVHHKLRRVVGMIGILKHAIIDSMNGWSIFTRCEEQ